MLASQLGDTTTISAFLYSVNGDSGSHSGHAHFGVFEVDGAINGVVVVVCGSSGDEDVGNKCYCFLSPPTRIT